MKKISDRTIEQLRQISPDILVNRGILKRAPNFNSNRQSGYCCPLCGSGERGGTGAAKFDSGNKLYCHACKNESHGGHKLSTIDLFAISRNLQHESFGKVVREMANFFGSSVEEEDIDAPRRFKRHAQNPPPKKKAEPVNTAELELIRADLQTPDEPLKSFVDSNGGRWRGLPIEILIRHRFKFVADWTPPKSRVEKKFATPTPRILIPSGENFYVARFVGSLDDYDGTTRKFVADTQKLNAGKPKLFLSKPDVLDSDSPIFAVEGAIDAVSVELVGFDAVALNSAANGDLLVDALDEKKTKPPVVIMMDSDESGRKAAPKLYAELINIGVPCCVRYLFDDVTKTDANDILIRDGVDNLRGRLESIMDSSLAELDAVATELKRRSLLRHDDALIDFLFQGDASDLDFARRFEKFFGDSVRWVKDVEEWILFERDENGGAVWQRHGEKNSCLLPRVRQMADVMLEYAENSDERELAEKLKRTRKNLSSITMLKSLDSILITAEDLDRHKEFLNVRNGVIDLTTGKLMTAEPSLLLTQTAAAVFNPNCADKTFAEFFKSILPDDETRAVIERFLGYALTAEVSAEKFLLISGEGANGKGTLLLTLRTLLKDFAVELPPDAVLENRGRLTADANGRATPELNGLAKRRLGVIDELPRNGRVDVAKLKRLTGGDYLPIRHLHHEYIEIAPTHKIIMCGNYRPQLDDARDVAFLRRLIAVKFEQDFSQNPDETLKEKLLADSALTGALNVLVPAAVMWYRDGLLKPSALMNQARQTYLDENDFVGDFLAEYYTFDEKLSTPRKALIKHLREQCADATRYRDADLCTMVAKVNGVTYRQIRNAWIFQGIGLKKQQDAKDEFDREILSSADFIPPPN